MAEGVATPAAQPLPRSILGQLLDHFRLASKQTMARAVITPPHPTGQLAAHAGATALAAVFDMGGEVRDQNVATVISDGNLTHDVLTRILTTEQAW